MRIKFPFALLLALPLLGAGCASTPVSNSIPTPPVTSTTATPSGTAPTETPITPSETQAPTTVTSLTPAATDATWQTYTNKALGFSFMWPTKGRYAPQWEVTFQPLTSASIIEDCWETTKGTIRQHLFVDGQAFCHSNDSARDGGTTTLTDRYVTKIGTSYLVIGFSKIVYDTSDAQCATQESPDFTSVKGSCVPFGEFEYRSALDGIIGTFKMGTR